MSTLSHALPMAVYCLLVECVEKMEHKYLEDIATKLIRLTYNIKIRKCSKRRDKIFLRPAGPSEGNQGVWELSGQDSSSAVRLITVTVMTGLCTP